MKRFAIGFAIGFVSELILWGIAFSLPVQLDLHLSGFIIYYLPLLVTLIYSMVLKLSQKPAKDELFPCFYNCAFLDNISDRP